jgi:hypothetical protein
MSDSKIPFYSKVIEFVFKWAFMFLIFGGILLFAFISLWPIIACMLGLCEYEISRPGEGDCNPNWTAVGAC